MSSILPTPHTHPQEKIPKLLNLKLLNTAKLQEVNAANLNLCFSTCSHQVWITGKSKIDRLVQRLECAQPDFAPGSSSLSSFHQKQDRNDIETLLAATDWMTECYQSKTNSASFQFAEDADQAPESRFLIAFQSVSSQLFTIPLAANCVQQSPWRLWPSQLPKCKKGLITKINQTWSKLIKID